MLMRIFCLTLLSASITCSKEDEGDAAELGQGNTIEIEPKNLKAYDTNSSVDVVAKLTQESKNVTLEEDTKVKLTWSCNVNGSEDT